MLRGLYTATSGMITQQRKQEVLAHNLANANTPGFKQDYSVARSFPEMLIERIRDQQSSVPLEGVPSFAGQAERIGRINTGVYLQEAIPDLQQGSLEMTGNHLDVAIIDEALQPQEIDGREVKPSAFFAVLTPEGEVRYTRNGNWTVDAEGRLVTQEGYFVLDAEADEPTPIDLTDLDGVIAEDDFQITETGRVIIRPDEVILRDDTQRVATVIVDNPYQLVREGHHLYRWEGEGPEPVIVEDEADIQAVSIRQGTIERSNVDPVKTMTEMMTVVRSYEANQKVIQAYDQTLDKAVNSLGRVGG